MTNQDTSKSSRSEPRFFYGYIVVLAAFIIQILMYGPRNSFGVFFKPMLNDFGWSRSLLSGAFSISTLIQGVFSVVMGGLNDRFGPRIVLTLCGIFVGLGFYLMSHVNSAWQLYLFYVVPVGIGMGGIYAPPMSTVARWFVKRRSIMTGIVVAGGGLGGLIFPPVANWLISTHGWRDSYGIIGAMVLVIIILLSQSMKSDPMKMGLEPYGKQDPKTQKVDLFLSGFTFKEAARTGQFWITIVAFFCFGYSIMTIIVHVVPHVTDLDISATTAANILACLGGAQLVGGIVFGGIADRIGNKQSFFICLILMSAAVLWILVSGQVWMFFLAAVIFGLGCGGGATLVSPLAAELFGMKSHGLILGVLVFCSTIGGSCGSWVSGYIFDVRESYQWAFSITTAFTVTGSILTAILKPVKQE